MLDLRLCQKCLSDPARRADVESYWADRTDRGRPENWACVKDGLIPCPVVFEVLEAGCDMPPLDCAYYLEHFLVTEGGERV